MPAPQDPHITVSQALLSPAFRAGTACIEYGEGAPYDIVQVAVARDARGVLMAIERHRNFKALVTDLWPEWVIIRGNGGGLMGHYGLWLPHITTLWAVCRVVELAPEDRLARRYETPEAQWPVQVPLGEKIVQAVCHPSVPKHARW